MTRLHRIALTICSYAAAAAVSLSSSSSSTMAVHAFQQPPSFSPPSPHYYCGNSISKIITHQRRTTRTRCYNHHYPNQNTSNNYCYDRHRRSRRRTLSRPLLQPLYESIGNNNVDAATTTTTSTSSSLELSSIEIDFQSLFVMDVVLFQRRRSQNNNNKLELGAVQENGNISPLSTYTLSSAYSTPTSDMMEFVVDEEHPEFLGLTSEDISVAKILEGSHVSYGSRQVGGGKGPGNPHGEESELLYYVDRSVVEGDYYYRMSGDDEGVDEGGVMNIEVVVNPDLEHLW
eukprot:CAMPEP_0183716530 /NCGR_PEP_ID=MMETSP0737-20130205/10415_1 /TAXON_ID=385413 /ORGANISM="Thalassiosira miniscula, Strain CCMP1093" /LENGTH=287 /DNA_ID=CAMNT_0025945819 /DNA_START=14 /DNA_END=877 /DNA_ORIENTATION=-